MTPEDWHRHYSELVRDRDMQARHVASLDEELYEERQKLNSLETAIKDWMRVTPRHTAEGQRAPRSGWNGAQPVTSAFRIRAG